MTNLIPYLNMDINERVRTIKDDALNKKQLLRNFLEGFKINTTELGQIAINDYINFKMLNDFENSVNPNYTYWTDTGLTWSLWFNDNIKKLSYEQLLSITTGYFKFHYIINNKETLKEKIRSFISFATELSNKINERLEEQQLGFITEVKLVNINNQNHEFIFDNTQLFKEPICNIRIIIKNQHSGGARIKKYNYKKKLQKIGLKYQSQGTFGIMGKIMEKINIEEIVINIDNFKNLSDVSFNNKIILDFHLEYFYQNDKRQFNMVEYKEKYLEKYHLNKSYDFGDNKKLLNREKLNRLNEIGMVSYCLLNLSLVDDEFGINVDKYRYKLFIDNYKLDKINFLKKLLDIYTEIFKNFKSYNAFFIDKINDIINKFQDLYFESFKDFIDKWFVSKFRPYINSFIIEINKELYEKFNVILFIAGGDAMRRYKNDISFTKDIDTKLYIGNVTEDSVNAEIKTLIAQKSDDIDVKLFIKDCVVSVITKHIVKLRNYLEQNMNTIFHDILQYDTRVDVDKGTKILSFKTSDNRLYIVDILLDSKNEKNFQQFRTRENKKRGDFPVDLYSIDFRTFIGEYEINDSGEILLKKDTKKKSHDISILDVVLQDVDNFYPNYTKIIEQIPVASLEFLLEDFYKTYTTPDRALARISSEKFKKDIERFNIIKDLYQNGYGDNGGILIIQSLDDIIINLNKDKRKFKTNVFNIFIAFLSKILNKSTITIVDINSIIHIFNDNNFQDFISKYPELKLAIMDMIFFKKNLYNENLSKIEDTYFTYSVDDDPIRQGYNELFPKLCSIKNNDGLVRHVIMFSNTKIKTEFKKHGIITDSISQQIKPKEIKATIGKKNPTRSPIKKDVKIVQPQPIPTQTKSSRGRIINKVNYNEANGKLSSIQSSQSVNYSHIPSQPLQPFYQTPLPQDPPPPLPQAPRPPMKRSSSNTNINDTSKRRALHQPQLKIKKSNSRLKFPPLPQAPPPHEIQRLFKRSHSKIDKL